MKYAIYNLLLILLLSSILIIQIVNKVWNGETVKQYIPANYPLHINRSPKT